MDTPERTEVRRALDELKRYLAAFIARHNVPVSGVKVRGSLSREPDIQALLNTILDAWDSTFRHKLPPVTRSYVHELKDVRNRWAHEEPFSRREADRARDTVRQLGAVIGAPDIAGNRAAPEGQVSRRAGRQPGKSQRTVMLEIYAAHGRDPERVVREYAAAERRGEVARKSLDAGPAPCGHSVRRR